MNDQRNNFDDNEQDSGYSSKKYKRIDIFVLIFCLIIAVSIWLFVMNSESANVERTVTLKIEGIDRIEELSGLSIIGDFNDIVSLTVSGSKTALDKYKPENYTVSVSDSEIRNRIEEGKAGIYQLDLTWKLAGGDVEFKSVEPSCISIYLDADSEKTVPITATYEGGIQSNCRIGKIEPKGIENIKISGPETLLKRIRSAVVTAALTGNDTSTNIKSRDVEFFDENGILVASQYIKMEPSEIEVYVQLITERAVPLTAEYTVDDKELFKYTVTMTKNKNITLRGDTALFTPQLTVDLGNITNITAGTAELSAIDVPEGLEIVADGMAKIDFTVIKELIDTGNATVNPGTGN